MTSVLKGYKFDSYRRTFHITHLGRLNGGNMTIVSKYHKFDSYRHSFQFPYSPSGLSSVV